MKNILVIGGGKIGSVVADLLVALGTIADIVPLTGENRILVSAGLERLNATTRPGLVALKQAAQCPAQLGVYEVGFQLAPRLNAAGRLETAEEALRLSRQIFVFKHSQQLPLPDAASALDFEICDGRSNFRSDCRLL